MTNQQIAMTVPIPRTIKKTDMTINKAIRTRIQDRPEEAMTMRARTVEEIIKRKMITKTRTARRNKMQLKIGL